MGKDSRDYAVTARLRHAEGALAFGLDVFGDALAAREGYKEHTGIEAVRFYLLQKHGWLPRDVMIMSAEEMRFALAEEMSGFKFPKEARQAYPLPDLKLD